MNSSMSHQSLFRLIAWSLFWLIVPATTLVAQEEEQSLNVATQPSIAELRKDYNAKLEAWRSTIKSIREIGVKYFDSDKETSRELRKRWNELRKVGREQMAEVIESGMKLYAQLKEDDVELTKLLFKVQQKSIKEGRSLKAFQIGKLLLEKHSDNERIHFVTAKAAIRVNEFDFARKFSQTYATMLQEETAGAELFGKLEELNVGFQREQEFRTQEKKADDLPRVKFETTKGDFVIELFENEAPGAVSNFVQLVNDGFYDNKVFHRVVADFMAQTGSRDTQGNSYNVGYRIFDECKQENARHHFYGSVSFANTGSPDSANCQFFVCTRPLMHLDGRHTVFGRVLSGLEVPELLGATHFLDENNAEKEIENPVVDHIIKATVLRKRDHPYKAQLVPIR